jgi:uncharacterized protein YjgD (DUF1641 family)
MTQIDLEDLDEAESASLENALGILIELEQSGTLEDIEQAAVTLSLAAEAVDDDIVTSVMRAVVGAGELFDTAAGEEAALRNMEVLVTAMGEAAPDPTEEPEQVGALDMVRRMRDPRAQRGIGFMLDLLTELGDQLEHRAERYGGGSLPGEDVDR